ncbi:MAG: M56 family metallopeptidase [Bacteroidota bacterium]|nr:M56 family metallopeptidase [Bacteroidota bacterium]
MDLTSFQHSLFLGALGNAILNSLWQAFLFWILYQTIIIFYKNTNAKFKHNLSVFFTFCSFIWFVSTFFSRLFSTETIAPLVTGIKNITPVSGGSVSVFHEIVAYISGILPYLSVAYMFLLLFLMVKLLAAYRHVHYIAHKNLLNAPSSLNTFASQVAMQLGIPKRIKIWISNHIEIPATIGFIKPVILIPFASLNHLTAHQLEAIILHELSHIKRNDYLVNLVVSIIETVLFFNPFIVLFIKIIKRERENCCDDFVLQYRYDPHSYASALLQLEQSRKKNLQLSLGAVSGKNQLLRRIKRITGTHTVNQFNYGQKLLALLITTAIFCSLAWIAPSKVNKEVKNTDRETVENNVIVKKYQLDDPAADTKKIKKSTNKIDQHAIKTSKDENLSELNKVTGQTHAKDLKSIVPANTNSELDQLNLKDVILKDIPKITIGNLGINLNHEINKGLIQAYEEINKIDWGKVQNNIKQSFSNIKIDQLTDNEKAAIDKAKIIIAHLKIDKQQFSSAKNILQEINQKQKLIADSIFVSGTRLYNQYIRKSLQNRSGSSNNFHFMPDPEPDDNQIFIPPTERDGTKPAFEFQQERLKLEIQKNSSPNESQNHSSERIKKSKHLIIEI